MSELVRDSYAKPAVRETAVEITRFLPARQYTQEVAELRRWLAEHIHFKRDPFGTEVSYTPALMLETIRRFGFASVDCDDAAVLAAALGKSIGFPARFVLLAFLKPNAPFAHVYTELFDSQSNRWVEMDVTRSQREIPINRISRRQYVEVR